VGSLDQDLPTTAVVGLGLMGLSLALALSAQGVPVIGWDASPMALEVARSRLPDALFLHQPSGALAKAKLVVLAVPLASLEEAARALEPYLAPDTLVTDLTSLKEPALRILEEALPLHVGLVGGHPMAGREGQGGHWAQPDLFQGRPWAVVPSRRTAHHHLQLLGRLARKVGAHPVTVDANEHDRAMAMASQLPYLVAGALARVTRKRLSHDPALGALLGPGWQGATRLASQPPWMDAVCYANRAHLVPALDALLASLAQVRGALTAPEAGEVLALGEEGRQARQSLCAAGQGKPAGEGPFSPL
jgi:prephenate dehydrogenase